MFSFSLIDFDEEDPLADLLSSSGENTPVKSTSRKSSTKETPELSRQQSKSKLIADLFGLNADEVLKKILIIYFSTSTWFSVFFHFIVGNQNFYTFSN